MFEHFDNPIGKPIFWSNPVYLKFKKYRKFTIINTQDTKKELNTFTHK